MIGPFVDRLIDPVCRTAITRLRRVMQTAGLCLVLGAGPEGLLATAQAQQAGASFQDGLARMEAGQVNEAVAIWSGLADQGQLESLYALGLVFESGAPGIVPDSMLAASYYQRAADGGLAEAQTNLGLLYAEGRGVAKSQEKAVALWLQAARKNNAIAQFNLGLAYFSGRGIDQDIDEALGLILVAALQGLPQAHYAIGQFYLRGLGLDEDRSLALAFLQQAKLGGHEAADSFVAELIAEGVLEADLNDASVQARLPRLPRLVAQKAIPQEALDTGQPSAVAGQNAVNVPRLPQQGQGVPLSVPAAPEATTAQNQASASPEPPAPLPLASDTAATPAPSDPADGGLPASQAATTFDGRPPLIDPTALSQGALNFGNLQLGQVDANLLKADPNLKLNPRPVPAPRTGLDLPLTLDDGQDTSAFGGASLGASILGSKLPSTDVLQSGVLQSGNSLAAGAQQPGALNQPSATALLDGSDSQAPLPLPLDDVPESQSQGIMGQAPQAPAPQASNPQAPNPQAQQGQTGPRLGPLRSAVPGAQPNQSASAAGAPASTAPFQRTPEGLMLLVGPKPQGVPYVLWIGTAETSKQGAELWQAALAAEPSILGGLEAILEPVTIGKTKGFRVLVGPIPDEKLGWQVCNAVKAGSMSFFCKVRTF